MKKNESTNKTIAGQNSDRKLSSVEKEPKLFLELMLQLHSDGTFFMNYEEKYYYIKEKIGKDEEVEVKLTNFIIVPLFTSKSSNGNQVYILKLLSKNETKVVEFEGEVLAMSANFKKHCMNTGRFNWTGSQYHLNSLIDFILGSITKDIETLNYKGWNQDEKIWLFPSHAYYKNKVFFPDEFGIFNINEKYLKLNCDKNNEYNIHPHINTQPSKNLVKDYFIGLKRLYGNYAHLCFGYIVASLNVDAIFSKTDFFPFLYLFGKHGQGKSTVLSTFSRFAGMKVSLSSPPTLDSLRKGLSKSSGIPFIVDEAEEKSGSLKGNDFFKNLAEAIKNTYMRQPFIRGDKDEDKKIIYPVRGTLMLGGEVLTSVSAIIQRSILVDSTKIVQEEQTYSFLRENDTVAYWVGQYLMRTSHEWEENFLELYDEIMNYFRKQNLENMHVRVRANYSIFLAAAFAAYKQLNSLWEGDLFLSEKEEVKDIYQFAISEMKETQRLTSEDHPSLDFLRKVGLLANKGQLVPNVDYKCVGDKDGNVYLHLAPSNVVDAYKNSEKNPFYGSSNKVVKDLQTQSFFKGFKKIRIGSSQPNSWIIQLSDPKNPESIKEGLVHPELPDTMIYFYR
ncbi:hypothetical protein [Bacillus sp. J37]|uniref:hypothetical protein n=1 Tax=Bacillus sp. J37 TaxID=935837 RepID=UPI0004AFED4F|nr:hypothetical protein [Bacillus sp. J37]